MEQNYILLGRNRLGRLSRKVYVVDIKETMMELRARIDEEDV